MARIIERRVRAGVRRGVNDLPRTVFARRRVRLRTTAAQRGAGADRLGESQQAALVPTATATAAAVAAATGPAATGAEPASGTEPASGRRTDTRYR